MRPSACRLPGRPPSRLEKGNQMTKTITLNAEQALTLAHALKVYLATTEIAATDLYCRLATDLMHIAYECTLDDIERLCTRSGAKC